MYHIWEHAASPLACLEHVSRTQTKAATAGEVQGTSGPVAAVAGRGGLHATLTGGPAGQAPHLRSQGRSRRAAAGPVRMGGLGHGLRHQPGEGVRVPVPEKLAVQSRTTRRSLAHYE